MAKFRRSVSAVKASNRFARMARESERLGKSGKEGRAEGKEPGTWSLRRLRRQMEAAMDAAYEQALAFQRACVFAAIAAAAPVVLCWLVNVTQLWACLLELHGAAERISGVTSIHVPDPGQTAMARDFGQTDADLMTWQRKMKQLQSDIFQGVIAGSVANINAANFEVASAGSGGSAAGGRGGGVGVAGGIKRFTDAVGEVLTGVEASERGVNLGLLLVGHVALTVAAYTTRRPEAAIAAGLMNFPLLRTVFLIKRLDDAMAQASGMVREAQMRLVELPLDVSEMQPPPATTLPGIWSADHLYDVGECDVRAGGDGDDIDGRHVPSCAYRSGVEAARVAAAGAAMSGQHHSHQQRTLLHSALMHKADRLAHYWESQDLGIAVHVLGLGRVSLNITLVLSIIVATLPMLWETARTFSFGPGGVVYARLTQAWVASRKEALEAVARRAASAVNTVIKKSASSDRLYAQTVADRQTSAPTTTEHG